MALLWAGETSAAVGTGLAVHSSCALSSRECGQSSTCLATSMKVCAITARLPGLAHSAGYGLSSDGLTTFINCSTCNLSYSPVNPPVIFDIPNKQ